MRTTEKEKSLVGPVILFILSALVVAADVFALVCAAMGAASGADALPFDRRLHDQRNLQVDHDLYNA